MEDWQERLFEEEKQLSERLLKLCSFLSRGAPNVTDEERALLRRQRAAMLEYHDAIVERMLRLEKAGYVKLDPGNADRV